MQLQLASVLFRSRPAQMAGSDAAAIALLNQRVGDALLASGRANVGVTEHNGVTCLKLTLLNPVVTLDDVKVLLNFRGAHRSGTAGAITCLSEAAPAAPLSGAFACNKPIMSLSAFLFLSAPLMLSSQGPLTPASRDATVLSRK